MATVFPELPVLYVALDELARGRPFLDVLTTVLEDGEVLRVLGAKPSELRIAEHREHIGGKIDKFSRILAALGEIRTGKDPGSDHVALFKLGAIANRRLELDRIGCHDLKLVHIERNPLAVVASLLNSRRPNGSGSLAEGSVLRAVVIVKASQRALAKYRERFGPRSVHLVSFEQFISDELLELTAIWDYFDVAEEWRDVAGDEQRFEIAADHRNLHPKYDKAPDPTRLHAYRHEMSPGQLWLAARMFQAPGPLGAPRPRELVLLLIAEIVGLGRSYGARLCGVTSLMTCRRIGRRAVRWLRHFV